MSCFSILLTLALMVHAVNRSIRQNIYTLLTLIYLTAVKHNTIDLLYCVLL